MTDYNIFYDNTGFIKAILDSTNPATSFSTLSVLDMSNATANPNSYTYLQVVSNPRNYTVTNGILTQNGD